MNTMAKYKIDLGGSDFKYLRENKFYYIDKSLLIKEILETNSKILLIPRPRRFGKTLNLSMLRYFFDVNHPENRQLFEGLQIWDDEEVMQHCCRYPVIFLTFKDAKAVTWDETFEYLKAEIYKVYQEHYYLYESQTLREFEKLRFYKILTGEGSVADYAMSIRFLSEWLHRYHGQPVVILVDEYDTPIHSGYPNYYDEVV